MSDPIEVRSIAAQIDVPLSVLFPQPPTDEQQARWARQRAAEDAYHARLRAVLAELPPGIVRDIAEMHQESGGSPEHGITGTCAGCDDCDGISADWPCNTVVLIGERLGVAYPKST